MEWETSRMAEDGEVEARQASFQSDCVFVSFYHYKVFAWFDCKLLFYAKFCCLDDQTRIRTY